MMELLFLVFLSLHDCVLLFLLQAECLRQIMQTSLASQLQAVEKGGVEEKQSKEKNAAST